MINRDERLRIFLEILCLEFPEFLAFLMARDELASELRLGVGKARFVLLFSNEWGDHPVWFLDCLARSATSLAETGAGGMEPLLWGYARAKGSDYLELGMFETDQDLYETLSSYDHFVDNREHIVAHSHVSSETLRHLLAGGAREDDGPSDG
jgi:hypothetical protein